MTKSAKKSANVVANNEVVKSQSTTTTATTQRVVETREMWLWSLTTPPSSLQWQSKAKPLGKTKTKALPLAKQPTRTAKFRNLHRRCNRISDHTRTRCLLALPAKRATNTPKTPHLQLSTSKRSQRRFSSVFTLRVILINLSAKLSRNKQNLSFKPL